MARSTATSAPEKIEHGNGGRRSGHAPVALPLGLWRVKRMWGLLLVTQLGMIAAVLLVCAVPAFARVALGAGLQLQVASHPGSAVFYAQIGTNQPTQQLVDEYTQRVDGIRSGVLRPFHLGPPRLGLSTSPNKLLSGQTTTSAPFAGTVLGTVSLRGEPAQALNTDLRVIRGRLPQPKSDALEVVVSAATAMALHLALGDALALPAQSGAQPPVMRVVGIIALASTTYGYPVDPQTGGGPNGPTLGGGPNGPTLGGGPNGPTLGGGPNGPTPDYWAETSNEAVLAYAYDWSQTSQARSPAGPSQTTWVMSWTAQMDLSHLSAQDLRAILDSDLQRLSNDIVQLMFGQPATSTNAQQGGISGASQQDCGFGSACAGSALFLVLHDYQWQQLIINEVLAGLLLADVLGLVLIFLARMASMLVERQEPLIALLRSRGASRGQVYGAFALQTLLVGVVGLLVGGALALPAARVVSSALLPAGERDALSILGGSLLAVSTGAFVAAVVVAVVLVMAMLRAIARTTALNVLTLRQESARPARKPLWQRLYLDVAAALLAFLAYGTYALALALAANGTTAPYDLTLQVSPLAVFAPAFLMVAGALLFLRVFPLLLRLGERIASRAGGVASVLALAQLARSARKTAGIVLPLALATCFLLFVLAANTTVEQQIADAAAFQAGADFSGGLTTTVDPTPTAMQARESAYAQVPGVRSVALGYRGATLNVLCNPYAADCDYGSLQQIQIEAVDAERFARTAIWPPQDAAQPLAPLMAQLAAQRDTASSNGIVPVLLDRSAATMLNVAPGASFKLMVPVQGTPSGTAARPPDMRFSVVAVVPYLPGTYGDEGGGLLADYATFSAVYNGVTSGAAPAAVAPNFVWLRTASDAASLARVRAAMAKGPLALSELQSSSPLAPIQVPVSDRRALAAGLHGDPLRLTAIGILDLGAVAALLLALCGALIAAGVAARERGMALALLRALGTEPQRVRAEIGWEQGVVYGTALALGAVLGAVLIEVMLRPLPLLIFAKGLGGPIEDGGPAARIIWPWPALAAAFGALVVICAVATLLAAWLAARPSLARTLRLSGE